jgi:DoxX-like family
MMPKSSMLLTLTGPSPRPPGCHSARGDGALFLVERLRVGLSGLRERRDIREPACPEGTYFDQAHLTRSLKYLMTDAGGDCSRATVTKTWLVAGYLLTAVVALFLTFDTVIKVLRLAPAVQGTTALGYPADTVLWIGMIELVGLALYLVPRTAVLGAILLTGHLGGAIATHVHVGSPLLSHTLFPIYVALLLWGGLYLREPRLRELVPFRR